MPYTGFYLEVIMQIERLKEILEYDQVNGVLILKKSGRKLVPSEDGSVIIFDKKNYRFKYDKLCIALLHNDFPSSDLKVLHRDMDDNNFKANNLKLVSRETYKQISEAYRNLNGGIRYDHHPTDKLMYQVQWFDGYTLKKRSIADLGLVKRCIVGLQLKYSKILTRYCVFD